MAIRYKHIVQINEHYYAMIDPTLITKSAALASSINQFTTALSKGMANTALGKNGVKFFSKQLVELKANCDARLYTDTIYKNADEKHLIIFNKNANHVRMKDIIGKSTLKIIDTNTEHDAGAGAGKASIIDILLSADGVHVPDETELSGEANCADGKSEE